MATGIMLVESTAASPEQADEYHDWYARHVRQLMAIDGVRGVRRFAPLSGTGPYVAIYELEGDDLAAIHAAIRTASSRGLADPPTSAFGANPTVRLLVQIDEVS